MSKLRVVVLFLMIGIILISCSTKNEPKEEQPNVEIAATVDDVNIDYSEIDLRVIQQLYDQLYKIYKIRKIALNETIKDKVIEIEAAKSNLSASEYFDQSILELKGRIAFESFCEEHFKGEPLISLERELTYYDINSEKGKELALKSYNKYLKDILIDSLMKLHDIKVFLEPPLPPEIDFDLLDIEVKGNANSDVFVLLIADLECEKCSETELIYEKLMEMYQDRVKFGYISYASFVNPSILALNSASKQNKYWEMKDSIKDLSELPDTSTIYRIANNIGLNVDKFKSDFTDKKLKTKIEKDFEIIRSYGIYVVPTLLVNGRLVYDPGSMEEIEGMIREELEKITK